jgi:hypothetical protein
MAMQDVAVDPWASAEDPKEIVYSNEIWGQVEARVYFCVLEKGVGKVVFDPATHSIDKRRTAIDLLIHPLSDMQLSFDFSRNVIAEGHEWAGIILPSLRDIGMRPQELNGKYVKIARVPSVDHKGNVVTYEKDGAVKEQMTFKFLKVFATEGECRNDYHNLAAVDNQSATGTPGNGKEMNPEENTAYTFLVAFVANACKGQTDLAVIRTTLATNLASQPLIGKYYTVDSPEVTELIMKNMQG